MVALSQITAGFKNFRVNPRHVVAELIGMALFVFIGCGAAVLFGYPRATPYVLDGIDSNSVINAVNEPVLKAVIKMYAALIVNSSFGIVTALAFGIGIMVSAFAIGHVSGCHLNPAVTVSLLLSGNTGLGQAIANILAQLAGACLGSLLLWGTSDLHDPSGKKRLGANSIGDGFSTGNALLGEAVMTFVLCYVVHLTAIDKRNKGVGSNGLAPIAIGFAVFLGHAVLIPLDGCSINPARSFGPALVSNQWTDYWVFVVGPLIGAILSVPFYFLVSEPWDEKKGEPIVDEINEKNAV